MSENMDISIILSIVAILGSAITYIVHDKKLKSQEARINDHEINRIEKEKEDAKRAQIRASSFKEKAGTRTIRIFNTGQSIAKNVRFEFIPTELNASIRINNFPYPYLNPKDSSDVFIVLYAASPDKTEIKLLWDDEYQKDNEYTQIIDLF
jgi:hypothetical protein